MIKVTAANSLFPMYIEQERDGKKLGSIIVFVDFMNRKGYYVGGREVESEVLDGIFGDVQQQQDVLAVEATASPEVIEELDKQYKQLMGVPLGSKQTKSGAEFARRQSES